MPATSPGRSYDSESLKYDYQPNVGDPRRVFHVMGKLVETFSALDNQLAVALDPSIRVFWTLDYLEAASLLGFFKRIVKYNGPEHLGRPDWEGPMDDYLFEGKRRFVKWLRRRETVRNRAQLTRLQAELHTLANQSRVAPLAASPIPLEQIADTATNYSAAVEHVEPGDSLIFSPARRPLMLNSDFEFTKAQADDILSRSLHSGEKIEDLLVRKPDLIGATPWEFIMNGKGIKAQIADRQWLERFRKDGVPVIRPGSTLQVQLRTTVTHTPDGRRHVKYVVVRVLNRPQQEAA